MADVAAFAVTAGVGAAVAITRAGILGSAPGAEAAAAGASEAAATAAVGASSATGAGASTAVRADLLRLFRSPLLDASEAEQLRELMNHVLAKFAGAAAAPSISRLTSEACYYVDFEPTVCWDTLDRRVRERLLWLLRETYAPEHVSDESFLDSAESASSATIIEVGPRLSFTSAFSTNAVSICTQCGVPVRRLERYRRYRLEVSGSRPLTGEQQAVLASLVHDRMTEFVLAAPLRTFDHGLLPEPTHTVPVLAEGMAALRRANVEQGLSMDEADLEYYLGLFRDTLKRDPTTVELFDIAQSNSEHSRHWFFKGRMIVDGVEQGDSLMQVVSATQTAQPHNTIIAFHDNSSAICGFAGPVLVPSQPGAPSSLGMQERTRHLLLTAETHNFPSGVAPFPGAETGTGGRLRDTHATGRGSLCVAGVCGYCVGNLHIPGYELPWESAAGADKWVYPTNLAPPLSIEIEASNGASDYGNKFGEPVVLGFTRSFGMRLPPATRPVESETAAAAASTTAAAVPETPAARGERREWIKPIMFTAGVGFLDDAHKDKGKAEAGMLVTKAGGPAYRIGMGGSAASSMMQGDNKSDLDFNAVQRGDAEMENKLNRVVRACVELGDANPIVSIHDQGAGGNCNVLKEICEPRGGHIDLAKIPIGDPSMSQLEIWGAEYQENDALLVRPEHGRLFASMCERERLPFAFVGTVADDGKVRVVDSRDDSTPVEMDVDAVLGKVPRKTFHLSRAPRPHEPLVLPEDLTVADALGRVLRLMSVASKRFLTNKVDRSVTGLVAQQQCVGPLHTPLADVAVVASSHFATHGLATAVGEQPIKGLLDPAAMARLAVGEAVTNLAAAGISALCDVKCSANWMWAAKLPGEGAALWDAAVAMRDCMLAIGVAVDGGKDSLSMAARCPDGELVKAPGELTVTLYAPCPDIRVVATPDLKRPGSTGRSTLILVDLSGRSGGLAATPRMGGTSLAHVYGQIGDIVPDLDDAAALARGFGALQSLLRGGQIVSLHDRSDGGLIVTLLEMAFAGNCGIDIQLQAAEAHPEDSGAESSPSDEAAAAVPSSGKSRGVLLPHSEDVSARQALLALFAEELGVVVEVRDEDATVVVAALRAADVPAAVIGSATADPVVHIRSGDCELLAASMPSLRDVWEETSFQLELLQANPKCVRQEREGMASRRSPPYRLTFRPEPTPADVIARLPTRRHSVCVLREEGSNGDREMAAALFAAGLDPWDVTMSDLAAGRLTLDRFRGVVFVGGFSYADVLDSAKGWAASIRLNDSLRTQFTAFRTRSDTFSLGVCNGCQLMALLGWVPFPSSSSTTSAASASPFPEGLDDRRQPRFVRNESRRYESRWVALRIEAGSPAILLRGMEGSVLGVWVAHGEGRAYFPDPAVLDAAERLKLTAVRYVDDDGEPTETYPFNPNGSPRGIAGLCSPDGRHFALMPHPERTFRLWHWPWMPTSWRPGGAEAVTEGPWLRFFQNARTWCDETRPGALIV